MEAHPRAMEAHPGAVEAHLGTKEFRPGVAKAPCIKSNQIKYIYFRHTALGRTFIQNKLDENLLNG
jgi:hypothetical protein